MTPKQVVERELKRFHISQWNVVVKVKRGLSMGEKSLCAVVSSFLPELYQAEIIFNDDQRGKELVETARHEIFHLLLSNQRSVLEYLIEEYEVPDKIAAQLLDRWNFNEDQVIELLLKVIRESESRNRCINRKPDKIVKQELTT